MLNGSKAISAAKLRFFSETVKKYEGIFGQTNFFLYLCMNKQFESFFLLIS